MATAAVREPSQLTGVPQQILEVTWGFAVNQIAVTAVELDIFTRIDQGHESLEDLARETGSSVRGLRMLLNALAGAKYLEKHGDRYRLMPATATYLSKKSPYYLGGLVIHSKQVRPSWENLTEVVRTGKPAHFVESGEDRGDFFVQFVDSLYALNVDAADAAAKALWGEGSVAGRRVLDIGAGSGVWGLAFARRDPQARVTVADWPAVIEKVTRKFAAREGASDRYDYLPGNFRDVDFGESRYDLAILGHICHSEGPVRSQRLIRRVHGALKPGGHILIADLLPDEGRQEAAFPLIFAINMLVNTEDGDTFTVIEYRQWLEEAGFTGFRTLEAPSPSPLIVARK